MENMERILEKIRRALALAGDNPNEHEALAAALKAQELMAKYNIDISQVETDRVEEEIAEIIYKDSGKHEMKKWKIGLASIIAKNFRCKVYFMKGYGTDVVFYGYKRDAKIAVEVFRFLYESGNKFAVRYYNKCKKEGKSTHGVMNTYLVGFRDGIKEVLDKQCTALMIVTPKEVEESYVEMSKNFGRCKAALSISSDRRAYNEGKTDGRNVADARHLEGTH